MSHVCICKGDWNQACPAVFHRDPPIAGEDTKPGKVVAREDVLPGAAAAMSDNGELALKGMVARVFGAALSDFADEMAACAEVALRELAKENLPRLNARILELMEARRR